MARICNGGSFFKKSNAWFGYVMAVLNKYNTRIGYVMVVLNKSNAQLGYVTMVRNGFRNHPNNRLEKTAGSFVGSFMKPCGLRFLK